MKRSGQADLPLHYGRVPPWLYERMSRLGRAIAESIVEEYGTTALLSRLSDPYWFQSLGALMGMDWHSSGITTSVMGALKKSLNPLSHELGIYICGGRGKYSRKTPDELMDLSEKTGQDGTNLVRLSRLTAKVDNTGIQDGYQLYLHHFVVDRQGNWTVVQQGMNNATGMARRYHWHSRRVHSFVEEPHTAICGINGGQILNLTDKLAAPAREGIVKITGEDPALMMQEIKKMVLPSHHEVIASDADLRRLGSILTLAYEGALMDFESLLLLKGLGPKTLRSLTLVSEVIHGTPSRFSDPARFAFAHGGKDGHPYPVQTKVYDQTLSELKKALERARLGYTDKKQAFKKLSQASRALEKNFQAAPEGLQPFMRKEKAESYLYGGRTASGKTVSPEHQNILKFAGKNHKKMATGKKNDGKTNSDDNPKGKEKTKGNGKTKYPGSPRQLKLF